MNGAENAIYFAKSPDANGHRETVAEHLEKVARWAGTFGEETGQQNAARVAGQIHDFGKYSRAFQEVLVGTRHGVDHAFPGAAFLYRAGKERLRAIIEAVNGHHDGLRSLEAIKPEMLENLRTDRVLRCPSGKDASLNGGGEYETAIRAFFRDFPRFSKTDLVMSKEAFSSQEGRMLYTRMLFSCLVDADYCVSAAMAVEEPKAPSWDAAIQALNDYRLSLGRDSKANAGLNALRDRLFDCCGEAGSSGKAGLYTLTAPTGTGKTLALLNFALRQKKRRIIIVLPFLSLI